MFLHLIATDGREGVPHASEEQAKVFVDLGGGAHGGAGIATDDSLLDGYCRRNALDIVTFWFVHSTEKLAGV